MNGRTQSDVYVAVEDYEDGSSSSNVLGVFLSLEIAYAFIASFEPQFFTRYGDVWKSQMTEIRVERHEVKE